MSSCQGFTFGSRNRDRSYRRVILLVDLRRHDPRRDKRGSAGHGVDNSCAFGTGGQRFVVGAVDAVVAAASGPAGSDQALSMRLRAREGVCDSIMRHNLGVPVGDAMWAKGFLVEGFCGGVGR